MKNAVGIVLLPTVSSIDVMPLGLMGPSPLMPMSIVRLGKFGISLAKLLEGGIGHYVHRGASINQHAGHRCAVQVPMNVQ
jgi:hypothetical protein